MTGKFHLLTGGTGIHGTAFAGVAEDLATVDGNHRIASPMDAYHERRVRGLDGRRRRGGLFLVHEPAERVVIGMGVTGEAARGERGY